METLKQLENEIKYFEVIDAGLSSLKSFLSGKRPNYKTYLKNTYMLRYDGEFASLINAAKLLLPFTYVLMLRQLIIALRERKDYINFEDIKTHEKYQTLLKEIFGENSDIPTDEANNVLTEICNRISHGEIEEFFNFENYKTFLQNFKRYEKLDAIRPIPDKIFNVLTIRDTNSYLCIQSKYTSRYKVEKGKKVKRDKPKTITVSIDHRKLNNLVALVMTNYMREIEPSSNEHDVTLQFYLNGILPMPANVSLSGDDCQNEDFEKIRDHYSSIETLDPEYAEIAALCGASLNPIFKVITLAHLYIQFPEMFKVDNPDEIVPQIVKTLIEQGFGDMNANITAYAFEKGNLYKEFLLSELVVLITNLENKKLYAELGNSEFIKLLACDILNVPETKITEKQIIRFIKTIRNALIHGRYVNGVETIDLYDEKPKDLCQNTAERIQKEHLEKELVFKFGLSVEDLEDIKDLCLQLLIQNYKNVLSMSK